MRPVRHARWLAASATAVLVIGGSTTALAATATAISAHAHSRDIKLPASLSKTVAAKSDAVSKASASTASASTAPGSDVDTTINPTEFTTTDNSITLDPTVPVPNTTPTVVTIADDQVPTVNTTVALPSGKWAKVVLDVSGTLSGSNYDRLFNIFDGSTQIFLGCTPEPTAAGISFNVQKDITNYLPILEGTRTFSVQAYAWGGDATVKLLFYPAGDGFAPTHVASLADPALGGDATNTTGPSSPSHSEGVPTDIVPIVPTGDSNDWNSAGPGQTLSDTLTLPDNIKTAALDIYAVGQIGDEFWWGLAPGFREIEISIDGKPAGVVEPYPVVFTGGVNPLIWRPLTGIHTLDTPAYRVDLTPFAGLLSSPGTHTISFSVVNDNNWWDVGGSLELTTGGAPVTGSVTTDTLKFPTSSSLTTANGLGDTNNPATSELADNDYTISGTITQGAHTYTDTVKQAVQYYNDEGSLDFDCSGACSEFDEQVTASTGSETTTGPGVDVQRTDKFSYTIGGPDGYDQNSDGSDFFLPANVDQQLTDVASQNGYHTSLSESIEGYGTLEEDSGAKTIANGITTGTITWNEDGNVFQRTVTARGGQIVQDLSS